MNFRNFAVAMLWNRNRKKIKVADWPDSEWPSYIPKYHLRDFAASEFEGANGEVTSACSMGIVVVSKDEIVDRFYSLIKPVPNRYDFWTTKVHGITYKDTNHAPLFPEVWDQVKDQVKGLPMVAHGISFDEACSVFDDIDALLIPDPDHSDEEERFIILGLSSKLNMLVICHCYRNNEQTIRIISARKATKTECRFY